LSCYSSEQIGRKRIFPFPWDFSKLSDLSGLNELLPDEGMWPRAGDG